MHTPLSVWLVLLCAPALAQQAVDLTQLSVDDLAKIQVTSASKKPESLSEAPAAIYVLTSEAIRAGGFTTLPEALRTVPGLYVVQTNSHSWQVSTRGFSGFDNRKMLVLVDGRSVYSPAFGGVFWDLEDVPLENIDRIEVIRGPGGTLWGANAVNGVINIVTKSADRTLGVSVSTSIDADTGYTGFIQFGGKVGESLNYRLYGKASYWQPLSLPGGTPFDNSFALPQGGMRADWTVSQKDAITIAGTEVDGRYQGFTVLSNPVIQGEVLKDTNFSARWKHKLSDRSSAEVFAYCDWYSHGGFPEEKQNTCSMEFQHDFAFNARSSVIWGGSLVTTGDFSLVDLRPNYRRFKQESGFFQYEFVAIRDRLRILAGSKLESNAFSGFQYQPQMRAVWSVHQAHSLWGSVSRAVRDPSHAEINLDSIAGFVTTPGGVLTLHAFGNPNLQSENVKSYELGYRFQPSATLSLDLATYYNSYENLIVFAPAAIQPPLEIVTIATNQTAAEGGAAQTHGAEFSANWKPLPRWMISPTFTETRGSSTAIAAVPKHLFGVQSRIDATRRIYLNAGLYHYNALAPSAGPIVGSPPTPGVPTFNRVDLGLSWHPKPQWTFGVWGRNLQSDHHVEFVKDFFGGTPAEIPRSVSFKLMWQSGAESK
jgi:iron complex outermembrane recepter protein